MDPTLKMTYSPLLKKPFKLTNIKWTTSDTFGTAIASLHLPSLMLTDNDIISHPFSMGAYYRAKISLIFQVAGSPNHAGVVLVTALPIGLFAGTTTYAIRQLINSGMSAPHAFLHANESTSVRLQVPYYSNTALLPSEPVEGSRMTYLDHDGDYAAVQVLIMNPLSTSTGSTDVTISVHAVFDDIEFYVPDTVNKKWSETFSAESLGVARQGKKILNDLIDTTTNIFKKSVGLHNPNVSTQNEEKQVVAFRQPPNAVESSTNYEKLDPFTDFDRITNDFIYGTKQDEMDIKNIISKPMYIGNFTVNASSQAGQILWARPITPMQSVGFKLTAASPYQGEETEYQPIANNFQALYWLSKYWKGSINVHIQSSMSNFQFLKLALVRNYAPTYNSLSKFPTYEKMRSMMVETLEFSAGGQIQTIKLPFASMFNKLPTTLDPITNLMTHGMYYIYLAQQLVTSGTSTTSAQFNVYISAGDDFQFYGYALDPLTMFGKTDPGFSAEASVMVPISSQIALTNPGHTTQEDKDNDHKPISNIRDYIRRMYRTIHLDISGTDIVQQDGLFHFDVYQLLSEWFPPVSVPSGEYHREFSSPRGILKSMFLGAQGGLKIKAVIQGTSTAQMWFVPPSMSIKGEGVDVSDASYMGTNTFPDMATPKALQCSRALMNIYNETGVLPYNWSSLAPTIERPNYINTTFGQAINFAQSNATSISTNSCIIEAHIPNLSPLNFVGDSHSITGWSVSSSTRANKFATDLGKIVIATGIPTAFNPGVANEPTDLNISLYLGCDDQTRFGFQIAAPLVAPPTVRDGGVPHIISNVNPFHGGAFPIQYPNFGYYPNN
jgi:capsid protein